MPDQPDPESAGSGSGTASAGDDGAGMFANADDDTGVGRAGTLAPKPPGGAPPGTFEPPPELDRDAGFEWPETEPGDGRCEPGTYTGTFMCEVLATPESGLPLPPDGTALLVTGPVSLRFERSMNGEFLELAEAKLEGFTMEYSIGFTAGLAGRLDCTTRELSADATEGIFGLGLPVELPFGNFTGTLDGTLDAQTLVLTGQWALAPEMFLGLGNCRGPWTASFTP